MMCQLVFCNTHNRVLNGLLLYTQLIKDSDSSNKDGTGIFSISTGIRKTFHEPIEVADFWNTLQEVNQEPLIGHVRLATTVGTAKKITVENTHPFESEHYLLAHNGTLEEKVTVPKTELIDSARFLERLEAHYQVDFTKAIKSTMDEFSGKFAFLIYDKHNNAYYIVRGLTAELNISYISRNGIVVGYVINTSKLDLTKNLASVVNVFGIMTGEKLTFTEPVLLEHESIFIARDLNVEKIGSLTENKKPAAAYLGSGTSPYAQETVKKYDVDKVAIELNLLLRKLGISMQDLDQLLYAIFAKGICQITEGEVNYFLELAPQLDKYYTKTKEEIFHSIVENTLVDDVYLEYNLEFPYFMESEGTLFATLEKVMQEREKLNATDIDN